MRKTLLIVLLLMVGCSIIVGQEYVSEVVETYKNSTQPKKILYYKKSESRNTIELIKSEEYYENGSTKIREIYRGDVLHGKRTEWYENGQKKKSVNYRDGVKHWRSREWYINGQMKYEEGYMDGKLDGLATSWHDTGEKESEITYKDGEPYVINSWDKNGEKDGIWTEPYENGQKKNEENYTNGELDGLWTGWHENGNKSIEGNFKNGEQVGLWTGWHENGQKDYVSTFKDGEIFVINVWDKNGKIMVNDGNGVVILWYENGQKKNEENYTNGELDGLWTSWYENGQKEKITNHKNGKLDGLATGWYENGRKEIEANYTNGELDGLWTSWYENGKKERVLTYKDGIENGMWTGWFNTGEKEHEVTYKDGEFVGIWTYWYKDGLKKSESFFEAGKTVSRKTYDYYENGQIKEMGTYAIDGKKDGLFTSWYENGKKQCEELYGDSRKNGIELRWYESGKIWATNYLDSFGKDSLIIYRYDHGNKYGKNDDYIKAIKDYSVNNTYVFIKVYDINQNEYIGFLVKDESSIQNGSIVIGRDVRDPSESPLRFAIFSYTIGSMKDSKRDGKWTSLYDNGIKKSEGFFKKGNDEGIWTYWYPNGMKELEGNVIAGLYEGKWIKYFDNGQKQWEVIYKGGREEGFFRQWFRNGNIELDGQFLAGKFIDEYKNYYEKDTVFTQEKKEIGPTIIDIDGNIYQKIKIGNQWWMAENLKVTHYRNGDAIPEWTQDREWRRRTSTGAFCAYDTWGNDESDTYGYLYNWHAVNDSRNIAPRGWHIPDDTEWETLRNYLTTRLAGSKMKVAGFTYWHKPSSNMAQQPIATNESGFSALPGGYRNRYGTYQGMRYEAIFWSSMSYGDINARCWMVNSVNSNFEDYHKSKRTGLSIRCIKD